MPPIDDDDELPPMLGELFRDITYDIHRAAVDADHEKEPHHDR